ncbi:M16 family metallopeptidase [Sphingobacterium bambusae]|uniref:M16 family metallopeptidase n=1 Tax=Sphingobacterium bambusae TaxID=662858 RepID=A0ABW6BGT0_9SPHI|nr:insulinase family protein [Sphingobacterium bambusae]WPL49454.1 insulinase family protein [Sphingobacterium bambusae]
MHKLMNKISYSGPFTGWSYMLMAMVALISLYAHSAAAQEIGLDPHVKYGKLANGFTYYIRHNDEPKQRAQLYLINKVGSVLETETQRGLAHFLEHMAFNGTTHFPKNELINYLQKSGVRFGSDLNAYTSFDETVYQLPIPTDDKNLFDNGLQIMRDWAQGLLLTPEELLKERGVILEEKRLRQGAEQRVSEKTLPILLNGSIYAQRLPIGTEDVLNNFRREDIVSFYQEWYRPDLQALIVVGDIDASQIEQQVKTLFADLKMPKNPKPRKDFRIQLKGRNQFITITDPEIPKISFVLHFKHEGIVPNSLQSFKTSIVRSLASQLITTRIAEYGQNPNIPMIGLDASYGSLVSNIAALSLTVSPKEGKLREAVEAGWTEIARIAKFGFTQAELDRAKVNFRSSMDRILAEKEKRSSAQFVAEYQRNFTTGELAPGIDAEYKWVIESLDTMSLRTVNHETKKLITDTDRDIIITGPEKESVTMPNETTVLQWLANGDKTAGEPYVDKIIADKLLANIPNMGQISSKLEIKGLGITELTLSNGVKVVLKPTDFQNDAIQFRSFSTGGTSLYPDAEFESARSAVGILGASGLGQFDPIELSNVLTGKQVQVSPYINDYFEGINGESSIKDLETALQLVYLYFNKPRADSEIFKKILANAEYSIKNRYDNPENVFRDTITAVMGSYNYRRVPTTIARLKEIDLTKALAIYKDRFADAGDFTFVFTGSFKVEEITPLLARYLGNLPNIQRQENYRNLGITSPRGLISKTVRKGKEDKASVVLVFDGDYVSNPTEDLNMRALEQILSYRLMERLREKESGVYTPSVAISTVRIPKVRYSIVVNFGCSTDAVDRLIEAAMDEIQNLQLNGVSADDLQKFKTEEKRQNEVKVRDNGFWLGYLTEIYRNQEDPTKILNEDNVLDQLNATDIQKAAKDYINAKSFKRFVHIPEAK